MGHEYVAVERKQISRAEARETGVKRGSLAAGLGPAAGAMS